jgi:hypothetical protein
VAGVHGSPSAARNALLGAVVDYLAASYMDASSSWLWLLVVGLSWLAYQLDPDPQRR